MEGLPYASMRPPEFTGGNHAAARVEEPFAAAASMRPPEFTGGNSDSMIPLCDWIDSLQ